MKVKILVASLTSCSGCITSMISLDIFPQYLEKVHLIYFPFLMDEIHIMDTDFALIEGCISEEDQVDYLKEIRKTSNKVIALGTCAAFGGISCLSTKKRADPIDKYIEIDGIIPGCPPPSKFLGNCLLRLLENKDIEISQKNLCSSCEFRGYFENKFKVEVNKLVRTKNNDGEERHCFLEDGILCLGPITRDGCECKCIKLDIPCEGCMGPVVQDYTSNVVNFLSMIKLSKDLRKYKGIFFRFSKPKIRGVEF